MSAESKSKIESLLFITQRPLKKKELANFLKVSQEEINEEIKNLIAEYAEESKGIRILDNGEEIEMTTSLQNTELIKNFLKIEINKELTPAALETLSVIAYRGPITEEEISELRGVNCSIILRHLLVKGLITEKEENSKKLYLASLDFMKNLGIKSLEELPQWEKLNRNISLSELLSRPE